MRHAISWMATLVLLFLLLAGPAVAQKKDKDKDIDKPNDAKMIKAGVLVGKVMNVYEEKRKIRLQISVPKLNPAGLVGLANAQRQMATAKTIQARIQAQRAMMQAQAGLYTMATQDVELTALDDVVVRMARPREEFDDKGKVKKLTKAELKELKGDPKEPGYKAEFSDVSTEQIIQVHLVKKKGSDKPAPRPKKKKDADEDVDVWADNLPQISRIMILREPAPSK
jgi:hypothetical protein